MQQRFSFEDLTREEKLEYFARQTAAVGSLCRDLGERLPPSASRQAQEFLEHNEFGIALELVVDVLVEEGVALSETEMRRISDLLSEMGLSDNEQLGTRGAGLIGETKP